MLFHVVVTSLRGDFQLPFSARICLFTRSYRKVDAFFHLLGSRGMKKHPPFDFELPAKVHLHKTSFSLTKDIGKGECDIKLSGIGAKGDFTNDIAPAPPPSILIPKVPSTKWELYQEILRLLSLTPPAPFSLLMSVHQRHPALQSIESYNVLLQLSIRHGFSRHTRFLLNSMNLNKIEPNINTEKLVVRYLVLTGEWIKAWQQTVTRYPSVADIPMPVLLELLAPRTRNFFAHSLHSRKTVHPRIESYPKPSHYARWNEVAVAPLDALTLILHRFPQLPVDELSRLSPRIISYVVRGLIRSGHHDEAITLTEKHLKTLAPGISLRRVDFARDLIHLHLSSGEVKLANYRKKRRLVERLLSLHPSLTPNSRTVFLLMRYMERSKRCGIEAYLFYKESYARWGPAVQSLEVKRRIVKYAIKQRKFGIAKEMSTQGSLGEPILPLQGAVRGRSDSLWRVRPWRVMYPRKGRDSRFWRRLVIRLLGRRRKRKRWMKRLSRNRLT